MSIAIMSITVPFWRKADQFWCRRWKIEREKSTILWKGRVRFDSNAQTSVVQLLAQPVFIPGCWLHMWFRSVVVLAVVGARSGNVVSSRQGSVLFCTKTCQQNTRNCRKRASTRNNNSITAVTKLLRVHFEKQ